MNLVLNLQLEAQSQGDLSVACHHYPLREMDYFCIRGFYGTSNLLQDNTNILAKSHILYGFKPKEAVKQVRFKEAEALRIEKYILLK